MLSLEQLVITVYSNETLSAVHCSRSNHSFDPISSAGTPDSHNPPARTCSHLANSCAHCVWPIVGRVRGTEQRNGTAPSRDLHAASRDRGFFASAWKKKFRTAWLSVLSASYGVLRLCIGIRVKLIIVEEVRAYNGRWSSTLIKRNL